MGGWAGAAHSVYAPAELLNSQRFILLFIKEESAAPSPTLLAGPPNKDISGFFRGKARALGRSREGGGPCTPRVLVRPPALQGQRGPSALRVAAGSEQAGHCPRLQPQALSGSVHPVERGLCVLLAGAGVGPAEQPIAEAQVPRWPVGTLGRTGGRLHPWVQRGQRPPEVTQLSLCLCRPRLPGGVRCCPGRCVAPLAGLAPWGPGLGPRSSRWAAECSGPPPLTGSGDAAQGDRSARGAGVGRGLPWAWGWWASSSGVRVGKEGCRRGRGAPNGPPSAVRKPCPASRGGQGFGTPTCVSVSHESVQGAVTVTTGDKE